MNNFTDKTELYRHVSKIKSLFIQHKDVKKCMIKLREAYAYRECTGHPKNFVLTGVTGTGKSTIRKKLEDELLPQYREDRVEYPLITVTVPSHPTTKNMAEAILIAIGEPLASRGSSTERTERIINIVAELKIKMFIFDEMQHFVTGGNKNSAWGVSNWLKNLIDDSKCSTVLMGTKPVKEILDVNGELKRRFSSELNLQKFKIDNIESAKEFAAIVKQIDRALGLPNAIDYRDVALIESMHFATDGIMDYIVKLLVQAYEIAKESGNTKITRALLEQAFTESVWADGVGKMNPFNQQFIRKQLNYKRSMPFAA